MSNQSSLKTIRSHPDIQRRDFLKLAGAGIASVILEKFPTLKGKADIVNNKITFFVLGDPQTHEDHLHDMVAKIVAENPDFVLIPGDCCMANGGDPKPWDKFFDIFAPLYKTPNHLLYAIPGNHDFDGDFGQAIRLWQERWDLPGNKLYYSFAKDSVYVAGLCINHACLFRSEKSHPTLRWPIPVGDMSKTQLEWFAEDLQQIPSPVKWKFVMHHEPGTRYCRLSHPVDGPGDPGVSGYIEPLSFDAGVDIIFRGHQHFYERTYPINIKTGKRDDIHGMTMITSGGGAGGAPQDLADGEPLWFDAVILNRRRHYCKGVIEANKLTWEAIDLDGNVFDRFELEKYPDGSRKWVGLPETGRLLNPKDPHR